MIYKSNIKNDMAYTRLLFKLIDDAMRHGDWETVAGHANELSAVWGTIGERATERHEGTDRD